VNEPEHPWQKAISRLQLSACASVAELIADTIPAAPNAATMARIAKARYGLFNQVHLIVRFHIRILLTSPRLLNDGYLI
jgi:hypothetical protein